MKDNPWTWIGLASVGFGGGFPLSKALLDSGVDVWQFFTPRYVIAALVVLVFVTRRELTPGATRRRGIALGVINVAVPTVLITFATDLLPASVAGILAAFIPVATIAFAHTMVPGERFVVGRVPGVVVAFAGATILVVGSRTAEGETLSLLGILLGATGVTSAGLGGALSRRFAMHTPAEDLAPSQFVAAAVVLVVVSTPMGGLGLDNLHLLQWAGLAAMATLSTALPFYAILKAAERAAAATVANIGYLVPVVAAVGSITFLGDPVTAAFAAGSTLIVFGVWLPDRLARRTSEPTARTAQ